MKKSTRRIVLFFSFFIVILLGYFILKVAFDTGVSVPAQFGEARSEGAIVAQDIVNESNDIVGQIAHINDLDKQKKYSEALKAITETKTTVTEIRGRALDLSKQLELMTSSLSAITSQEARQAALDSISSRLALISRLITYTDNVNLLLAVLENHFKRGVNESAEINRLVNEINADVRAVNAFNSQAGQAMDRFDTIVQ